jgi:hypothetical protein
MKNKLNSMFRPNQFIVLTKEDKLDYGNFNKGFIYKQLELSFYLIVNIHADNLFRSHNKFYVRENKSNWRFATTEEVKMYKIAGTPVFVGDINIDNYSII